MHSTIDLRSDTTTKPTLEMRNAMATAEVGDDVYDDDPTIHKLQARAMQLTGKKAALFMPSGTMSNAVAIKAHTKPGDEILLDEFAHSMIYEVGMPATISQVMTRQFRSVQGVPNLDEIKERFYAESLHSPGTALLVLENTHNRAGGAIIPLKVFLNLRDLATEKSVPIHLDGARLFNAVVASGVSAKTYAECVDSLTFCLSKGLGCPAGSILCGTESFIYKARRIRKMLGGAMRQAGILAAAGLYALDHHIDRLAEDHANAKLLAKGLSSDPNIELDTVDPPTNMIYFNTKIPAMEFQKAMQERGVLCGVSATHRIRLVTHLDIDSEDVLRAIEVIAEVGRLKSESAPRLETKTSKPATSLPFFPSEFDLSSRPSVNAPTAPEIPKLETADSTSRFLGTYACGLLIMELKAERVAILPNEIVPEDLDYSLDSAVWDFSKGSQGEGEIKMTLNYSMGVMEHRYLSYLSKETIKELSFEISTDETGYLTLKLPDSDLVFRKT